MNDDNLTFDNELREFRKNMRPYGDAIRGYMNDARFKDLPADADQGEMKANIMLAYRHIEDAIMRVGKVIQAYDGGRSIYDK